MTEAKTFTLARFHPTVTVRVAEGPRFIPPELDIRQTGVRRRGGGERIRQRGQLLPSQQERNQVKSRRTPTYRSVWLHGSVSKAAEYSLLYAHVAPHACRLLTVRIACRAVSFLATYEASDVGGDVPLPRRAPSDWAPRQKARGYAVSMAIGSRLISFLFPYLALCGMTALMDLDPAACTHGEEGHH